VWNLRSRYLVLYTFHRIAPLALHRLIRLKRMNPSITIVPCFGIRQRLYFPTFVDLQPAPAKFLNWTFLKSTHLYELSRAINEKVESVRRKAEIDVMRDTLHKIGMKLCCDFTPMGYFNQDLALLNWFQSEGRNLDFDFLVFFEYDMLATKTIESLYGKYTHYDAGFVGYRKVHPSWYWYKYPLRGKESILQWLKDRNLRPVLYRGLFAGHMVSREVLIKLERMRLPYGFCEMRWPSILNGLGFRCIRLNFPMVRHRPSISKSDIETRSTLGLFHPVYDDVASDVWC